MLALTGILCTLLTVITSFFYILSELFFSKDVTFVSALPISSHGLLTAKLIRIWLGEAGIALAVCLPTVVLYGIGQSQGVLYYVKALLLVPTMPMVPIAVVTLLSFLLIRVSALWKRREALTVVMSMLFLVAFMWVEMQFSMSTSRRGYGERSFCSWYCASATCWICSPGCIRRSTGSSARSPEADCLPSGNGFGLLR